MTTSEILLDDQGRARDSSPQRASVDTTAWSLSLVTHLILLVITALVTIPQGGALRSRELRLAPESPTEPVVAQQFRSDLESQPEVGAGVSVGVENTLAHATVLSPVAEIPTVQMAESEVGEIELPRLVDVATGPHTSELQPVKGIAGYGTQGALGAIDRLTHEILLSLEERPTLVVWLLDQSASLYQQRQAIRDRFDRIYEELGIIADRGHGAFQSKPEPPLLSAIVAFGQQVSFRTKKPTADLSALKAAIDAIELDDSGIEQAFSAVVDAARQYRAYRRAHPRTHAPTRNVMFILVTDEAADDQARMDEAVAVCRPLAIPVYAIGVPAPFGRAATHMKWIDPDDSYDQTPQWGLVHQGPESFYPERLKIGSDEIEQDPDPLDSGFGPFALTRLCVETGGIYFTVHPNRRLNQPVSPRETAAYSGHLRYFFDSEIMRRYQPHYGSVQENERALKSHPCLAALVQAAQRSWVAPMTNPALRFVKTDDAQLANDLTIAQRQAAILEPEVDQIIEILRQGEGAREKETQVRWQAGYDLAVGQALTLKVRTSAYNGMLATAKRGMAFRNATNNTWTLQPAEDIPLGSSLQQLAQKAHKYLDRVIQNHPGTPWALLAQRERQQPLGWRWQEAFTQLAPPPTQMASGEPAPPRDEQRRMLAPPRPKREIPRL